MEAVKGVRILDMTHVQAGPTCSQSSPGWAPNVIKFENPQGEPRADSCAERSQRDSSSTSLCSTATKRRSL